MAEWRGGVPYEQRVRAGRTPAWAARSRCAALPPRARIGAPPAAQVQVEPHRPQRRVRAQGDQPTAVNDAPES
ncbi:hypothetical protein AB4Z54_56475, partial [Streptomyces sp. MCAF7]